MTWGWLKPEIYRMYIADRHHHGAFKKNLTFCGYTIFEEKIALVLPLMVYSDVNVSKFKATEVKSTVFLLLK